MKNRRSRLWVGIGLVALCSGLALAGWQPVEAQPVDVLSLPADAPGSKVAFQRQMTGSFVPDSAFAEEFFLLGPGVSEVRIDTVTAACAVPENQTAYIEIKTTVDGYTARHFMALGRAGTWKNVSERIKLVDYTGTHYVRLLDKDTQGFTVFAFRHGDDSGFGTCVVSISGYTTPQGSTRP